MTTAGRTAGHGWYRWPLACSSCCLVRLPGARHSACSHSRPSGRPSGHGTGMTDRLLTTPEVADLLGSSPDLRRSWTCSVRRPTVLRPWRAGAIPGHQLALNCCASASRRSGRLTPGTRRQSPEPPLPSCAVPGSAVWFPACKGCQRVSPRNRLDRPRVTSRCSLRCRIGRTSRLPRRPCTSTSPSRSSE